MPTPAASPAELAGRAARLHAAALACSDNGRPAAAVRQLRAGLRLIGPDAAGDSGATNTGATNPGATNTGATNPGATNTGATDPAVAQIRGRLLISLAWAESERGQVDTGFRLLDEAERHITPAQRPILLAQRGLLLKRSGRNDLALRQYDEAVALLSEQSSPLDLVKALNNRSLVHLEGGRIRLARADLRRCGQVADRHGLALHLALSQVNLGCMDVLAGDLPSALGAFAAARSDYERLAPGRLAALAVERARALVAAGLFTEADRELAAAVEQATTQRLSHTYADAVQVRAEAALLAGRPDAAGQWARMARSRFLGRDNTRRAVLASLIELRADLTAAGQRAAPEQLGEIASRGQVLARRLTRLGLPEDARVAGLVTARALTGAGQPTRAARIVLRHGPPGRVDRLDTRLLWRLTRAELAAAGGHRDEASRHLLAGMAALHRHRAQLGSLDLQTGAAVHGQDLARAGLAAALASGSPAAVYRWSERFRAQALLLPAPRPPDDPAAAEAIEELRQARHALRGQELAGRPAGPLRARVDKLQRYIREQSWAAPGLPGVQPSPLAPFSEVRDDTDGAALVIYLRDGPLLRALVIAGGPARLHTLGAYAAAEEAVLRLRADLDTQAGRLQSGRLADAVATATRQDAAALASAVLSPLLPQIGERDLVVIPAGVLTTVPWAVLPGCAGRPVTVAPSATAWHASRRRPGVTGPTAALLVAGPGTARGDAEVAAIAALHPGAAVFTGANATPAATLAGLGSAAIAHLAAHGHHQAENALFSTLELAGGPLLGYDLQRAARAPTMVVLSSCDLGLTDVRPGDETFGMVTALLAAGTRTVVASVARVADDTAMRAMIGYHRAVTAGSGPAAALASALAGESPAGFVCFGAS
jgi:tetratricopeptide (TPR) repeat protein